MISLTSLVTGPLQVNTLFLRIEEGPLVLVDPGDQASSIIAQIKKMEASLGLIVLTHGHFDHLGALAEIHTAFPEAGIAIHKDDALWLGSGAIQRHRDFFGALGAEFFVMQHYHELPQATYLLEQGSRLVLPDGSVWGDWEVLSTPGHSPGSICLYSASEKILISGDTLFAGGFGRTDVLGGDYALLAKSIQRLSALNPETRVIPGHGRETTIRHEFSV